jgi:hypothetical protein
MYLAKSAYNLKLLGKMHEKCTTCEQPFSLEPGFYFGATYVSYGITVVYMFLGFIFNWLVIGAPIMQALPFVLAIFVVISPVVFRLSRSLYLHFFVRYNPGFNDISIKKP